jgi:phosphoglycolate phosphatase
MLEEILDFTAIDPHKAIMIGDTTYDVQMAANANIAALGAGYGVHHPQELLDHGALEVLPSFAEILMWFNQNRLQAAFS